MQPVFEQERQRSFIEQARRDQIVAAAIEAIAEHGYAKASMAQIAARAGISRGLISYHFSGKRDLIAAIVTAVYHQGAEFMGPRIEAASGPRAKLAAYIDSNLRYIASHAHRMIALMEIFGSAEAAEMPGAQDGEGDRAVLEPLRDLFADGQRTGVFREFDTEVMARAVRSVIDSVPARMRLGHVDVDATAAELTTLFDLATCAPGGSDAAGGSSTTDGPLR